MPTFFCSTTGNNGNAGSQGSPWLTPQFAASNASGVAPGDTVYYRGGTYTGGTAAINSTITTVVSGSNFGAGAVTHSAYDHEVVSFFPGATVENVIDLQSQTYIIFNEILVNAASTVGQGGGMYMGPTSQHIRFQNGEIKNAPWQGVNSSASSPGDLQLLNNRIHDNGHNGSPQTHNVYLTNSNNLIQGNEIYNSAYFGITIYDGSAEPANNVIWGNWLHDNCLYGGDELGISGGDNNQVINNIISGSSAGDAIHVEYASPTNTLIYNNTIVMNGRILIGSDASGSLITNNILRTQGNAGAGTVTNNGSGTGQTTNSTSDPTFVNAGGSYLLASDVKLQSTSNCRNAGTTLVLVPTDYLGFTRPQGTAYCIGAYEFVSTVGTPPGLLLTFPSGRS